MALSAAAVSAISEARAGRGRKLAPAVKQELSNPSPAAPAPAAAPEQSFSMPDFSSWSIPGSTPLIKAMVVLGVLLLGIALYSKLTGQPMALSLQGFRAGNPTPANPNAIRPGFAQTVPSTIAGGVNTMNQRIANVNPSKVSA